MHSFLNVDDIRKEIGYHGQRVFNIWNIKKQGTTFLCRAIICNKDIYEILDHFFIAKFNPSHLRHPLMYYGYGVMAILEVFVSKARRVKCAENHPTSNCLCNGKSKDIKCMLWQPPSQFHIHIIYKDL
jgi:hypothetical protein